MRVTGRRRGRAAVAAAATSLMVAGPLVLPAQAQDETVLRVALVQEIDHLNPFTASFASSTMIGRMTWEFLTLPSAEDTSPTGGVAESWQASEDGLTWTFAIREGMTWSDGEPVTAEDAAFTFNRIMDDPKAAEANGSYVTNFASVTAPDERTLVIETKEPQSSMTALDVPIVPEHVWSGVEDMSASRTDEVDIVGVGDGPFLITEFRRNELVRLKANPDYWRGRAQIDELQFVSFKNPAAAVNALRNGEVDFVNRLTPVQFDALKGDPNIQTNQAVGRRYRDLLINHGARNLDRQPIGDGHPALEDIRVRRAIAMAIQPRELVDKVSGGYAQVGGGVVPAIFEKYHWEPGEQGRYGFDPAAAEALLDEAGYRMGPDGVRVGPGGKPLELRLLGRSSEDYAQRAAEYVSSWLGDVGIRVNPNLVSDNEVNELSSGGEYDLAFSGWGTSPDPDYVLSLHTCANLPVASGSSSSPALFCDDEYDRLYQQQRAELDPDKRAGIVHRAQQRYYEQIPSVVLQYDNALEAYRSDKFAEFPKQPAGTGQIMEQSGYWGFYGATPAEPATGDGGGDDGGGIGTGGWIAIGGGVLVVLVVGGVALSRRGKSVEDRE
ncbi:ABC transporter substrate-binding protein [Amycolatopsis cihanbeyliensis]|nr:ABC transporter substrate-binding protein [Amycolatopsis cihanbeyliensis]